MLIEVTSEDIRLGKRNNCWKCPIARAITRKLNVPLVRQFVEVSPTIVFLEENRDNVLFRAKLGIRAIRFIRRFDKKKEVFPFRFKLDFLAI